MTEPVYLALGLLTVALTGCSSHPGTSPTAAPISTTTTAAEVGAPITSAAADDSHAGPAHVPTYVCDEVIVVRPLGYKDGDTVVVTGRGNCQPTEGTVGPDNTMRGPWQITQRNTTPNTYHCGKQPPAIIGLDGKPIELFTISGNIASAPAYVNGYDCIP
ncbi:hypothetical protein [Nocardia mikamii]|uniref:hypothetical protein n=1 Tax=Nocardia mikamii TaxID=508464 RepID=UPI0007A4754F|nr:hypothetical protein [Nocardia mikamii]